MPKCIMMVGLPGVGKSTWLNDNMPDTPIASSDYYIEEAAKLFGSTYTEMFKTLIPFAETAFNKYVETLSFNSNDFVVDRTNLSPNSRARVINLVMKNNPRYTFDAIVFKTPSDREHMDRLASRHGKNIPNDVMENMKRMYRVPTLREGFANVHFIG